ncbi:hypothetical protein [Citricoccus muralis]|uniref:Primosomal protein n=1 Tax=Citricoccus muralis TaxID=169134 RepID=A0ABY8H3V3_9MICC|nr:hypothetical protein [Citricoccus muralis]WFP15342.1 hypothetical protein P8192_07850 [Citricoccus muralis]
MSTDPRIALDSLVSALHEHLAAASAKRSDSDPVLDAAYQTLADSFEAYEDALYEATGEVTPLDLFDDDDDDEDSDDENDEDDEFDPNELSTDHDDDDLDDDELLAAEGQRGSSGV